MVSDEMCRLAVLASPPAIMASDGLIQRDWVVRVVGLISPVIVERAGEIQESVRGVLLEAFRGVFPEDEISTVIPLVGIFYVDARHLVLRLRTPSSRLSASEPGMAGVFGAIRAIDELVGIEDLQGFPREAWPLVLAPRGRESRGIPDEAE